MAAKQTETVANRADKKNSTQCQPNKHPTAINLIARPLSDHISSPRIKASNPNPNAANPERQITKSTGGKSIHRPKIAVNPHANTTKCICK
jgi:hypothetical protein